MMRSFRGCGSLKIQIPAERYRDGSAVPVLRSDSDQDQESGPFVRRSPHLFSSILTKRSAICNRYRKSARFLRRINLYDKPNYLDSLIAACAVDSKRGIFDLIRLCIYRIILFIPMGYKNMPFSYSQALHNRISLFCT